MSNEEQKLTAEERQRLLDGGNECIERAAKATVKAIVARAKAKAKLQEATNDSNE